MINLLYQSAFWWGESTCKGQNGLYQDSIAIGTLKYTIEYSTTKTTVDRIANTGRVRNYS